MDTAEWYRQFAEKEARGSSPTYERLAWAVSRDEEVLALLGALPQQRQRQPNTLFAVVRLLGGPVQQPSAFHEFVVARWHRAAAIVAADPPQLVRGDLEDALPTLIPQAPTDATLVVFHSSVLYQVLPERRAAFVDFMRRLDHARWVAIEAPHVLPYADLPPPPDDTALNVLALDEVPLAWTRGHGQGLVWFGPTDVMAGSAG